MTDITALAKKGCFVQVHFARPTLQTKLTWKELGLPQLDGSVSAPSTKPPSKEYNEFQKLESRARTALATYTTGRKSLRFMYFHRYEEFVALVQPVIDAYLAHVEPFLATWETTVQNALAEWGVRAEAVYSELADPGMDLEEFRRRLVARLRRSWPEGHELRPKFDAELEVQQFAFAGASEDEMFAMLKPEVVADMKKRAEETFERFLNESMLELRQRALDTVRNMHRVLVKGETVSDRSIKPLRSFVDQFKELAVAPDGELQGRLEGILAVIDGHGGAAGLRDSTDAWLEVQNLLGEVTKEAEALVEDAVAQAVGPGKRKIKL